MQYLDQMLKDLSTQLCLVKSTSIYMHLCLCLKQVPILPLPILLAKHKHLLLLRNLQPRSFKSGDQVKKQQKITSDDHVA